MNSILPKVLQIIESKKSSLDFFRNPTGTNQTGKQALHKTQREDWEVCREALRMIQELKKVTKDDNLHLIIPLLLRVVCRGMSNHNDPKEEIGFKIEIVRTITSLVECPNFREYIATIVHNMITVTEVFAMKEAAELYSNVVKLFCAMAKRLNIDFAPFIPLVLEQFKKNKKNSEEFNQEVEKIVKLDLIDHFKNHLENLPRDEIKDTRDDSVVAGARG